MIRFMLVFLCLFTSVASADTSPTVCQTQPCVAIVDAGSTGTRLHIYAYDEDDQKNPIHVHEVWRKKITPGFSSIQPNTTAIYAYLNDLFADAPSNNIPVYFYATAGMRLISDLQQKRYYETLTHWFSTQSQWSLLEAKTITGQEEGVFGWLAVNYKLGRLQSLDEPFVGLMDMGGASVQVTFPVSKSNTTHQNNQTDIDIYNKHISLFAASFLGLGQTEISHQHFNTSACFSHGYPLPTGEPAEGDADTCQQEITKSINLVHGVHATVAPTMEANAMPTWYAISGISNLVKTPAFNFKNNEFTSRELLEQADQALCQPLWDTLIQRYPNDDYLFVNCLSASYYYALMVQGYGFFPEQTIHSLSKDEEPDWTLGAALHANIVKIKNT